LLYVKVLDSVLLGEITFFLKTFVINHSFKTLLKTLFQ
jgi:hypothetical protein